MLVIIFLLSFISLISFFYLFATVFSRKKRLMDRMAHYLNPDKDTQKTEKDKTIPWREGLSVVGKALGKSKMGGRYNSKIENQLIQAHIPLKPEEFLAVKAVFFTAFSLLGYILSEKVIVAVLLAFGAFFIPNLYITLRKKRILQKIDQQLPDTIALISNSLKAGYSFLQAVDAASKELLPPISLEFAQIIKEVNLGVSTEEALESLSQRAQSEDLKLMILAVLIQRQIGGNLSEILDNISETIRSRIKIKGEISILTAQGRISGLIICLMPAALGAAMFFINPQFITPLFTNPIGWAMLGMALLMQAIGIYSIRKIIRIEV